MTPEVSVIVPVYNVGAYVADCLRSVIGQATPGLPLECIVVDDCSTDSGMDTVESLLSTYSGPIEFSVVRHDRNRGLSAARNTGISRARGRYILFLDSDDLLLPGAVARLHACAAAHPGCDIVAGDFETFPQPGLHSCESLRGKKVPAYCGDPDRVKRLWFRSMPTMAWNKLYRRRLLTDNRLRFREGIIHEDVHWNALLYPYVSSVGFVSEVTYSYRKRAGSITGPDDSNPRCRSSFRAIYAEMFARRITWDTPWTRWALTSLFDYRLHLSASTADSREIASLIIANPGAPRSARRLARLSTRLPRPLAYLLYRLLRRSL